MARVRLGSVGCVAAPAGMDGATGVVDAAETGAGAAALEAAPSAPPAAAPITAPHGPAAAPVAAPVRAPLIAPDAQAGSSVALTLSPLDSTSRYASLVPVVVTQTPSSCIVSLPFSVVRWQRLHVSNGLGRRCQHLV